MKNSKWSIYAILGSLVLVYIIGEATGYLFFAMVIILPVWVWLWTEPDKSK
jgi:predicted membrane-bound dolichyl-phosphate-mannose-protein mannosyltransferase